MKDACAQVFPAFLSFQAELRQFIVSRVNNREVAEDLTNDLALKLYHNCRQIPEVTNLRSWLFTIARNAVIDYFRKHNRETELPESLDITDFGAEAIESSSEKCLQSLIGQLPEAYRNPLLLSDYRGLSQYEVAEKLGLSYTNAKTRISRARSKLKSLLQNHCQEVLEAERTAGKG